MKHSRKLVTLLLLLSWACSRNEDSKSGYSLATLSLTGLEELNASKARLTARPLNGAEKVIELSGPQYNVAEAFVPGDYTFSLELFGDSQAGLIASTKVAPCNDVSATLDSGANTLNIPVCKVKGIILNPSEKAEVEIKIIQVNRSLFRDYTLSCKNSLGSFTGAQAKTGQELSSSLTAKPMIFSETKVENDLHVLTGLGSEGSFEVRASIDSRTSSLAAVTLLYQTVSGTLQELRFAGWECEAKAIPVPEEIPDGFPSWDSINEVDPEKFAAEIYDGVDPIAESFGDDARCSIYVMTSYVEDGSIPIRLMRSSFAHNGHSHRFVKIKDSNPDALSMSGKSLNGQDEMKLTLKQPGKFSSLSAARIRWLHDDHFHNDTCERLTRRGS